MEVVSSPSASHTPPGANSSTTISDHPPEKIECQMAQLTATVTRCQRQRRERNIVVNGVTESEETADSNEIKFYIQNIQGLTQDKF